MSTEFKREERYIVFKLSDVEEHFTPGERQQLARLAEVQRVGRSEAGKPPLECVVVEADWPEYEPTWKVIEARVAGERPAPSVPSVPDDRALRIIHRTAGHLRLLKKDSKTWGQLHHKTKRAAELLHRDIDAMLAAAPEAKP